jgi:hypothetical protein
MKVDIEQSNVFALVGFTNNVGFNLTADSSTNATWTIEPDLGTNGALFASGAMGAGTTNIWTGTNVWVSPGDVVTSYTLTAYATAFTNYRDTATCSLLRVELRELAFTNNHTIKSDDGSADYIAPHWQDSNGDGDASDGRCYPLCFTRNTKMKLSVGEWHVEPADPGTAIKIKGDGPGNLDFSETAAFVSGNDLTITSVPPPFPIKWISSIR